MKNLWVTTASVCALAGAFAGTASAHVPPAASGSRGVVPGDPELRPLTCENGHIFYGWDGAPRTSSDFVGLYDTKPDPNDTSRNRLAYSFVSSGGTVRHSFDSEYQSGTGLWAAYWTHDTDSETYVIVSEEGPSSKFCS
ncbi:hypothetical protein ACFU6K_35070 [Kitasatospora sp. NPDC057512]|uniref:hypothetical protein n=1 Tax=Kitasatospora sp. NPDC057512 TaxID=3346154 RepID=UPI00367A6918